MSPERCLPYNARAGCASGMSSTWELVGQQAGSSLLELALLLPVLLLLLAGAVDFGQAYYTGIEVSSAAESGAAYGVLNPTDTAGMSTAALLDAADVPAMSATATWGCECSDGTGASTNCAAKPSCPVNLVNYVDVSTAVTYQPILDYGVLPSAFALTGHSRMRVAP